MDNYTDDRLPLAENLEKIKLPAVQMPLYKQKLKNTLLSQARLAGQPAAVNSVSGLFKRSFGLHRRMAYALPIAVMFLLAAWLMFAPAPQIYAHLVLEVNPSFRLMIDTRGRVAGFEAMDPEAQEISRAMDLQYKNLPQAIVKLVDGLYGHGLLTSDQNMILLIYPAADTVRKDKLADTLETARTSVNRRIEELDIQITIQRFTMEAETYRAAEQAGLRPSQYLRLLDKNVSSAALSTLFRASEESGIEKNIYANRFSALADLIAEMIESGVSEKDAVKIVQELLASGVGIGLLEDTLSELLDNLDEGERPARAINKIRKAVKEGRIDKAIGCDDENGDDRKDEKDNDQDTAEEDDDTDDKDDGRNDDAQETDNSDDDISQKPPDADDEECEENDYNDCEEGGEPGEADRSGRPD